MNPEDVSETARALPERYADRLSADVLEGLQLMRDGGEFGELISLLAAALAKTQTPVTSVERDELRALAEATGEGGEYLDALTVQG